MEIETKRLLLRPFEEDDAEDVFEYLRKPAVHCFECMKAESLEEVKEMISDRAGEGFYVAIVLKETGKVIGEIFADSEGRDPKADDRDTFSPCWMLNEKEWGNGYMSEAVRAYFGYLFETAGARRIYTYTEDYNIACQRLCEKMGMRREGEFKEFVSFVKDGDGNPVYENTLQYAILKKEWDVMKNQKLTVPLSVVLEAFEMSNDDWEYFLDLESMETVWLCNPHVSGEYEEFEELVEKIDENPDRYLKLPTQFEIHPYRIMEEFVYSLPSGEVQDRLASAIRGRGAFRRFKDTAMDLGIIDDWYEYESNAQKQMAIQWCEEHGLEYC